MASRTLKTIVIFIIAFAAIAIGMSLFRTMEKLVHEDIAAISDDRAPFAIHNNVDAICFDNGRPRADFEEAALRSGLSFLPSFNACGVDRSCCNLGSDLGGVIGLVRGNEITCVEVNRFVYLLDADQPFCAKSSQLHISQQTFTTRFNPPGRSWFSTVGRKYFQIGQKQ